jgi:hypothetical protein
VGRIWAQLGVLERHRQLELRDPLVIGSLDEVERFLHQTRLLEQAMPIRTGLKPGMLRKARMQSSPDTAVGQDTRISATPTRSSQLTVR